MYELIVRHLIYEEYQAIEELLEDYMDLIDLHLSMK